MVVGCSKCMLAFDSVSCVSLSKLKDLCITCTFYRAVQPESYVAAGGLRKQVMCRVPRIASTGGGHSSNV